MGFLSVVWVTRSAAVWIALRRRAFGMQGQVKILVFIFCPLINPLPGTSVNTKIRIF